MEIMKKVVLKGNPLDMTTYQELQIAEPISQIFLEIQKAAFVKSGNLIEATSFALATFMNTTETLPVNGHPVGNLADA